MNWIKEVGAQRLLAIMALIGAIGAAYTANDTMTWLGIAYYSICIAALLFIKHPRVTFMLWFAVCVHILLIGYSLWNWETYQIVPCLYCFSTAAFALIAAMVMYRLPLVILPVLLFVGMLYVWPYAFAVTPKDTASPSNTEVPPAVSPIEIEPATTGNSISTQDDHTNSGKTGADQPTAPEPNTLPAVLDSPQITTPDKVTQPEKSTPEVTTQPKSAGDNTLPGNVQPSTNPKTGSGSGTNNDKPKSG